MVDREMDVGPPHLVLLSLRHNHTRAPPPESFRGDAKAWLYTGVERLLRSPVPGRVGGESQPNLTRRGLIDQLSQPLAMKAVQKAAVSG